MNQEENKQLKYRELTPEESKGLKFVYETENNEHAGMALQAKDLRVGNYYTDGFGLFGQITPEDIQMLADDPLDDHYQGIPLTPDILVKCGFKPYTLGEYEGYIRRHIFVLGMGEGVFTLYQNFITRFKYLHQLQSIYYWLVGQELEVNL